ncbi:MAG: DUF1289 domain-containing protein [Pseudomonadota bacterium]
MNSSDPKPLRYAPAVSPCVQICALDDNDVCVGCGRTVVEIAGWAGMSAAEREAVMRRLETWSLGDND